MTDDLETDVEYVRTTDEYLVNYAILSATEGMTAGLEAFARIIHEREQLRAEVQRAKDDA